MAESTSAPEKKPPNTKLRLMLIGMLVLALIFAVMGFYIHSLVSGASGPSGPVSTYAVPHLSSIFAMQALMSYNYNTTLVPYALFDYNAVNASNLTVHVRYLARPVPRNIYILNWSNECRNCPNVPEVVRSMASNLIAYGVENVSFSPQIITSSQLGQIQPNSTLIVLNGLLPDYMANSYVGTQDLISYLTYRGVTIIYVGQNFSHLLTSQSVIVPNSNSRFPLTTSPTGPQTNMTFRSTGFYFNQTSFAFPNSRPYGPITYTNMYNGTVLAFSNYLSTWPTPGDAGHDIARALYLMFWMPSYTGANFTVTTNPSSSGSGTLPVFMSNISIPLGNNATGIGTILANLNSAYPLATIAATSPTHNTVYSFLTFRPNMALNGFFSMPQNVTPGYPFNATMRIFVNRTEQIEPHINIYDSSFRTAGSLAPFFSKNVSPPYYSFLQVINLKLPPGRYIAQLVGFSEESYGYATFTVPNISLNILSYNTTSGTFIFSVLDSGTPLSNFNATITMNGQYKQNVTLYNGTVKYQLPLGTSVPPNQDLNFQATVLSRNYTYTIVPNAIAFTINRQYIEFMVALLIVVIEITVIKAPARDDFYVDVSSMPRPVSQSIKIKYTEILGVFDKLNIHYHWRYMPLSKADFRFGVSNNIHYNAMSVTLTYKNIDAILDAMVNKGLLVSADDLYAPATWIEQSKHDVEYLATFKKLRISLVSHGHVFTDLDKSDAADIVTTIHSERAYIVISSKTSRFQKVPVYANSKTYIVFLNSDKLGEFTKWLYSSNSRAAEELKMYVSVGSVVLIDADSPEGILT